MNTLKLEDLLKGIGVTDELFPEGNILPLDVVICNVVDREKLPRHLDELTLTNFTAFVVDGKVFEDKAVNNTFHRTQRILQRCLSLCSEDSQPYKHQEVEGKAFTMEVRVDEESILLETTLFINNSGL